MNSGKKDQTKDKEDFRAAMCGVQPLKPDNRLEHISSRPDPIPAQRILDEKAVLEELLQAGNEEFELETGEQLLFLRPDHSPRLLRRLRRGHFSISDSIDLHQMSERVAAEALVKFLSEASLNRHGCVRIVHGKGLHSSGRPILKMLTHKILRKFPSVVAFASCRPVDGGTGAVVVLFKSPGRTSQ
jgi:DNA-nicking Smr family endonuclease